MLFKFYITAHSELTEALVSVIGETFNLDKALIPAQLEKSLGKLIQQLKSTNYYLIESPYVDRIYRDSYYLYYSSKYGSYNRDCIKVSIFDTEISSSYFRDNATIEKLQEAYRGFFIIRPTEPAFLGRNHIAPNAFEVSNFGYCPVNINSTVNGVKLEVSGFPHASQDGETHSCAETTIWAIMEYFGTKYPDYKPVKPSAIHDLLRQMAYERQIPSNGLSVYQISYALKELGFGCKVYAKSAYKEGFEILLDMYISSGIPVVAGLDDFDIEDSNNIGHAVLIIGKKQVNGEFNVFKTLKQHQLDTLRTKQITLFDLNDTSVDYVFIDDNHPPYQLATIKSPVIHYPAFWENVQIKHLIVPLYPKIYLEAVEARNFALEFLVNGPFPLESCSTLCLNCFLASSRTFKHKLALSNMEENLREIILEKPMPKFIWVLEMGSKEEISSNKRSGILILDATEPNISDNKPIIVAAYQNNVVFFGGENEVLTKLPLTLHPFKVFLNNLTDIENE